MKKVEANVPKHLQVRVSHFHDGNSTPEERSMLADVEAPVRYYTQCMLVDKLNGNVMGIGDAVCHSTLDVPSRSRGRAIAVGRALADYLEYESSVLS